MSNNVNVQTKPVIIAFLMIAFAASALEAAFETFGETSVRAQGMGGAYTAMSEDSLSWLVNPAGLSRSDKKSIGLSYSSLYPGLVNDNISQSVFGTVLPGKRAVYGITYAQLSSAKYKETMYVFSASKRIGEFFSGGINVKSLGWAAATLNYFNSTSETLSRRNISLDLGMHYYVTDEITWGMNIANINRPDIGSLAQELMPLNVRTGIWYKRSDDFNIALDMTMQNRRQSYAVGLEKWLGMKKYAVRGGWKNALDGGNLSLGGSYVKGEADASPIRFDLAYIYPLVMKNLPALRMSVSFWFGNTILKQGTLPDIGFSKRVSEMDATDFEQMQIREGNEKLKEVMRKITVGEIVEVKFEPNSDKIAQGYNTLDMIGQTLYDYPKVTIKIEVHTDSLGDPDANLALTYKQGDTIKDYLVKKFGIGAKRIEVIGYGGTRPIVSSNEPGGIERNRRVEISVQE